MTTMGSDIIVISDDEDERNTTTTTTTKQWPSQPPTLSTPAYKRVEEDDDDDVFVIDNLPFPNSSRKTETKVPQNTALDVDCCVLNHVQASNIPKYEPVAIKQAVCVKPEFGLQEKAIFVKPECGLQEKVAVSVLTHNESSVAAKEASLPHQYEGKDILPQFQSLFPVSQQFAYDVQLLALDLASVAGIEVTKVLVQHETLVQDADLVKVKIVVGTLCYTIVFGDADSPKLITEVDRLDNKVLAAAAKKWLEDYAN